MSSVYDSWDAYWRGSAQGSAYNCDGISHPALREFWIRFLSRLAAESNTHPISIVDVASGTGTVADHAVQVFGNTANITCLDVSDAALAVVRQRIPSVRTVVADASRIPLESGTADVVTSQFGAEYAGPEATAEAARLVAPGGFMVLLMHHRFGLIYDGCGASLDAIEKIELSRFVQLAFDMFKAGFEAVAGSDRQHYEQAAAALSPAVGVLESIMTQHGPHVAGDLVYRLYNDVADIHEQIQHYESNDVLSWLDRLDGELGAYKGRMESMREAALDQEAIAETTERLHDGGFTVLEADPLIEADRPLAWKLVARRQ